MFIPNGEGLDWGWILDISERTLGNNLLRDTEVVMLFMLAVRVSVFSDSFVFGVLSLFLFCADRRLFRPEGTSLFVFLIGSLGNTPNDVKCVDMSS